MAGQKVRMTHRKWSKLDLNTGPRDLSVYRSSAQMTYSSIMTSLDLIKPSQRCDSSVQVTIERATCRLPVKQNRAILRPSLYDHELHYFDFLEPEVGIFIREVLKLSANISKLG